MGADPSESHLTSALIRPRQRRHLANLLWLRQWYRELSGSDSQETSAAAAGCRGVRGTWAPRSSFVLPLAGCSASFRFRILAA